MPEPCVSFIARQLCYAQAACRWSHILKQKLTRCLSSSSHARSLRENWTVPGQQEAEEKENNYKEMYPQPLLQWVLHLWSSLWADSGTNPRAKQKENELLVRPPVRSLARLPSRFLRCFLLWWIGLVLFSLGLVKKCFVRVCVCVGVVVVDCVWVLSSIPGGLLVCDDRTAQPQYNYCLSKEVLAVSRGCTNSIEGISCHRKTVELLENCMHGTRKAHTIFTWLFWGNIWKLKYRKMAGLR